MLHPMSEMPNPQTKELQDLVAEACNYCVDGNADQARIILQKLWSDIGSKFVCQTPVVIT